MMLVCVDSVFFTQLSKNTKANDNFIRLCGSVNSCPLFTEDATSVTTEPPSVAVHDHRMLILHHIKQTLSKGNLASNIQ